jgi:hypothetical protein
LDGEQADSIDIFWVMHLVLYKFKNIAYLKSSWRNFLDKLLLGLQFLEGENNETNMENTIIYENLSELDCLVGEVLPQRVLGTSR